MFCGKCGKEVKEGNLFCTGCGERVSDESDILKSTNSTTNVSATFEYYNWPDGSVCIAGGNFVDCQRIEIPKEYAGKRISAIGDNAFSMCGIQEFVFSEGITNIGERSFLMCEKLEGVNFSSTINLIDEYAFSNCTNLTVIELPESFGHLCKGAFSHCKNLRRVVLGNALKILYDETFLGCVNLVDIRLPDGLLSIGEKAFAYCSKLQEINIPSSVKLIHEDAFLVTPITIICENGSYAEDFAREYAIPYRIIPQTEITQTTNFEDVKTAGIDRIEAIIRYSEINIKENKSTPSDWNYTNPHITISQIFQYDTLNANYVRASLTIYKNIVILHTFLNHIDAKDRTLYFFKDNFTIKMLKHLSNGNYEAKLQGDDRIIMELKSIDIIKKFADEYRYNISIVEVNSSLTQGSIKDGSWIVPEKILKDRERYEYSLCNIKAYSDDYDDFIKTNLYITIDERTSYALDRFDQNGQFKGSNSHMSSEAKLSCKITKQLHDGCNLVLLGDETELILNNSELKSLQNYISSKV